MLPFLGRERACTVKGSASRSRVSGLGFGVGGIHSPDTKTQFLFTTFRGVEGGEWRERRGIGGSAGGSVQVSAVTSNDNVLLMCC